MSTATLEEAQAHLPQRIERFQPGEVIVITRDEKSVARLLAKERPERKPRHPGGTNLFQMNESKKLRAERAQQVLRVQAEGVVAAAQYGVRFQARSVRSRTA